MVGAGLISRWRERTYRRQLTSAGPDITFGGRNITIVGGTPDRGRGITIGAGCTIYDGCFLVTDDYSERCGIEIGANTHINYGSYICGTGGLTVGSDCLIGPFVQLIPANHRIDDLSRPIIEQGHDLREIVIGDGVWIGARATVLAGVTIGEGAVVAAGAVVVDDVSPAEIVAGVPAKHLRSRGSSKEA